MHNIVMGLDWNGVLTGLVSCCNEFVVCLHRCRPPFRRGAEQQPPRVLLVSTEGVDRLNQ